MDQSDQTLADVIGEALEQAKPAREAAPEAAPEAPVEAAPEPAAEPVAEAPAEAAPELPPLPDLPPPAAEAAELPPAELQRAVEIARRLREDPKAALAELEPVLETARVAAGVKLPGDLEEAVERGDLAPSMAREVAQLRMRAADADALRREREERASQERAMAAAQAVSEYERQLMRTSPDYVALRPVITRLYELAVRKGAENRVNVLDPRWAVETLQQVVRETTATLRATRPQPAVARQVERAGSPPVVRGKAPSSLEEAIGMVLEGRG